MIMFISAFPLGAATPTPSVDQKDPVSQAEKFGDIISAAFVNNAANIDSPNLVMDEIHTAEGTISMRFDFEKEGAESLTFIFTDKESAVRVMKLPIGPGPLTSGGTINIKSEKSSKIYLHHMKVGLEYEDEYTKLFNSCLHAFYVAAVKTNAEHKAKLKTLDEEHAKFLSELAK
ncbi:MAG: hypothetical protein V4686_00915 [Patescibacteria group bacterium]